MYPIVQQLILLIPGGIAGAVVVWLGRNWISERLKRSIAHEYEIRLESARDQLRNQTESRLESLKSQLKTESEGTLERLKAELQQAGEKRRIQFETVFEKREELLKALHERLIIAVNAAEESTAVGSPEKLPIARQGLRALHGEMEKLSIYFPEAFCRRWHDCVEALAVSLSNYGIANTRRTQDIETDRQLLMRAVDSQIAAMRSIRTDLRQEIRRLLGTE